MHLGLVLEVLLVFGSFLFLLRKDLSLVLFEFDRSEIYLNIILPKEHKMMHSEKISGKVVFRSRVTNAIFCDNQHFTKMI